MLNSVVLMGRLTATPECKQTTSGVPVTSFCIAVERDYARNGADRETDFINIVAWRGTAEFICKYFKKGDMIALQGAIQCRKYEDRDGRQRVSVEVVTDKVSFCGGKSEGNNLQPQQPQFGGATYNVADIPSEDDLPF